MRRQHLLLALFLLGGSTLEAQPSASPPSGGPEAAPATPAVAAPLARDQRRVTVAVATRFLPRGTMLRDQDFARRDTVIVWRWGAVGPDTTRVQPGWVTRRPIAAGEVLRSPAVMPPPVVESGRPVHAIWQEGPVRLVLAGTATNTAALGAPVGVRIDRGRRLDGIAVAPDTVRLR